MEKKAVQNPIVTRYKNNPILTKNDVPYPVATAHNAGVVKYNDDYVENVEKLTLLLE